MPPLPPDAQNARADEVLGTPRTPNGARILVRATPSDDALSDIPVASDDEPDAGPGEIGDDGMEGYLTGAADAEIASSITPEYRGETYYPVGMVPLRQVSPHTPIPVLQTAIAHAYPFALNPAQAARLARGAGAPVYAHPNPDPPTAVYAGQAGAPLALVQTAHIPQNANNANGGNAAAGPRGVLFRGLAEGAIFLDEERRRLAAGGTNPVSPTLSSLPASSPIWSSTTCTPAKVEQVSSSPIDVDWSSDDAGQTGDTADSVTANGSTTPVQAQTGTGGPTDTIGLAGLPTRANSENSDVLYWQYLHTPMAFEDMEPFPAHVPQPTTTNEDESGEQSDVISRENETGNSKKRLWTGSPNPEDLSRGRRRPREAGTTPMLRNLTELTADDTNPWGSSNGLRGAQEGSNSFNFLEAAETPGIASLVGSERSPLPLHVNTSGRYPTPHNTTTPVSPVMEQEEPIRRTVTQHSRVRTRPAEPAMDIDGGEDHGAVRRGEPKDTRAKASKGKARATRRELEEDEPSSRPEPAPAQGHAPDSGWDESDILEARQQSLRQALRDRASRGMPHDEDDFFGGTTQDGGRPQPSVFPRSLMSGLAGPSGVRRDADGPREAGNFETSEWRIPTHRNRPTAPSRHARQRERSSFHALPNTRAAEYVDRYNATPGPSNEERGMPQRSPASRLSGLRRPTSPTWRDSASHPARLSSWRSELPSQNDMDIERPSTRISTQERLSPEASEDEDSSGQRRPSACWTRPELSPRRDLPRDEQPYTQDGDEDGWRQLEDGELMPTVMQGGLHDEDWPTDVPRGGFPRIHHDDPEFFLRGMALEWVKEMWGDPPNSVVMVDIYNYRASDDDSLNRRIADAVRSNVEDVTGEHDFDVVPPEPEPGRTLRTRERPTRWAIRGLTARGVARMLERRVWSFRSITFFTSPRAATIPYWICMLDGFLNDNVDKIRPAILRVLQEPTMRDWIARMAATNPDLRGRTPAEAVDDVLASLRVEPLQMGNGNYIVNVYIRSPTRDVREWRRWVAALRARRYPSFANGTGRVRQPVPCSGCRGVNHPAHLCPFQHIQGWNGLGPGEDVFHAPNDAPDDGNEWYPSTDRQRRPTRRDSDRDRSERRYQKTPRGSRGPPHQKKDGRGRGGGGRGGGSSSGSGGGSGSGRGNYGGRRF